MKDTTEHEPKPAERRRFLGLLGGFLGASGAAGFALPFLAPKSKPQELDLKEADFYRPHDLAG